MCLNTYSLSLLLRLEKQNGFLRTAIEGITPSEAFNKKMSDYRHFSFTSLQI